MSRWNTSLDVVKAFLKMWLTFKLVDFESSRLPSIMWVGLIQSVEGLKGKDRNSPRKRGFCLQSAFVLKTEASALPWVSSCFADFRLATPHNCVCQFLKRNQSLSLSLATPSLPTSRTLSLSPHTHTHTHTHYWFCFLWRTLTQLPSSPNIHGLSIIWC